MCRAVPAPRRVALVTAIAARDLDTDLAPLQKALIEAGADAMVESWDDPAVDWAAYDVAVLRSTWDYHERLAEFFEWLTATGGSTHLENPIDVIRWSLDKRYALDLEAAGVPPVPTAFFEAGEALNLPDDGEFVVKPSVSAGSRDTGRFGPATRLDAEALAERIWSTGRTVIVQPYLPDVDTSGERALVYLAGEYSHAFRKGPILRPDMGLVDGLFAEEDIGPATASAAERSVGDAAVAYVAARFGAPPLYARIDLLPSPDGPRVLEMELAEPSLCFHTDPPSAARFATAILAQPLSV